MKRIIMVAVVTVICGGQAYAGGLEGERVNSGVRFGESVMTDEAPAVRMSGDFRAAPKAALTEDVRKGSVDIPTPTRGMVYPEAKNVSGSHFSAFTGVVAAFGTIIGLSFIGVPIIIATVAAFIACVFVASIVARITGPYITHVSSSR